MRSLLVVVIFAMPVFSDVEPILSNYRISGQDLRSLQSIAEKFEIHARTPKGLEVHVPTGRAKEFLLMAPNAELLEFDIHQEIDRLQGSNSDWLSGYHQFAQVETILKDYASNHPSFVTLTQYGKSQQNNPLYALRVCGSKTAKRLPQIMLTGATHGDELITVEVVLGILDHLISGYSSDPHIQKLVDNHEIFVVPVVNPDGFKARLRTDNGRDPNRSYPWPENMSNTPTASIRAIMQFVDSHQIAGSIDFHASGEMIMYPWAYTESRPKTTDEAIFRDLGNQMARHNNYVMGQISTTIYIAPGSSADYYYWKHGSFSYGIEMATSKVPHSSQIASVLKDNLDSTLDFIEHF